VKLGLGGAVFILPFEFIIAHIIPQVIISDKNDNKKEKKQQQENNSSSSTCYTFDTANCALMFKKFREVYGSNLADE
jgi:hypothetical protein